MRQEIELYIGNKRVEFDTDPAILYTYQQNDIENPTVVKNGFSKTITIKGTKNNNQIFGDYWNVERIEGDGRNANGVAFNASKKIDFVLYVNSEVYESGYAKLDSVKTVGRNVEYNITLYGGIGEFFYNLSTNDDTGQQLKLSDLDFLGTANPENEFDYTININTIKEAWDNIDDPDYPKWNTINFMPCYNGLPDDFDADKCLINLSGTDLPKTYYDKDDEKTYRAKNNFVLADLPAELTEHEMRDYRSYLMRPVIRMKSIIEACCNQKNNGGYDVELDPEFFNDSNPYWTDTWLTLPTFKNLELENSGQILTGATLTASTTTGDEEGEMFETIGFTLGEFSPEISDLSITGKINAGYSYYKYSTFMCFYGKKNDHSWDRWDCFGSLFCQLLAYNGDTVIGASKTYNLTSAVYHNGNYYIGKNERYSGDGYYTPNGYNKEIENIWGTFSPNGFMNDYNRPIELTFTINNLQAQVTSLKMKYFWGASEAKMKRRQKNYLFSTSYENDGGLWPSPNAGGSTIPASALSITITSSNIKAVIGDSIGRTGTEIKKDYLLKTEATPCDYLLSYCKQFGLYFRKDIYSKKIYIETRRTYYERDNVIDLEKIVDRSKEINITPLTFNSKWLQFNPQNEDTMFANKYKLAEGHDYGEKLVNTGYDFDSNKTDILKDICIKGAIEGHEKSKYFTAYQRDATARTWMVGMKYNLFDDEGNTTEIAPTVMEGKIYGINEGNGLKYYDLFPKVQFRDDDNSGVDGNNVLVFFSGFKKVNVNRAYNINYILSDDNQYMTDMNEGTPCWLLTTQEYSGDTRLCYKLTELPVFERYRTQDGSNTITNSLDFGAPRQLYCQGYEYDEATTIYDTYWATYIRDYYDVNTKILDCYVLLDERPNPSWMRRFYWFDNCIWRLNKITDWNVAKVAPTKMQFIKVQDITAYTNKEAKEVSSFSITLSKYNVAQSGETIQATVHANSGVIWNLFYSDGIIPSRTSGTGTSTFNVVIPQVRDNKRHQYTLTARADVSATATILQDVEGEITITEIGAYVGQDVPGSGDSTTINIKSTYPWTLSADRSYVSFDKTSGTGNTEVGENVVVTFAESDTMAYRTIAVTAVDSFNNNTVWRKSQSSMTTLHYAASGGTKTVYFETSGATFVLPDWLAVIDNGDGSYDLIAKENLVSEIRRNGVVATVRRTPETKAGGGDNFVYTVEAIQDEGEGGGGGSEFAVTPTTLQFNYTGSSAFLTVTNTVGDNWKIVAYPSWVTFSQSYGSGSALINVTAESNPDTESRTGVMIVWDATRNKEYNINCFQFGSDTTRTFTVNPTTINASKNGGSYPVTLTYINRGDDFVTTSISGTGVSVKNLNWIEDNGSASVVVEPNITTSARTTTITFTPNETDPQTVTVYQAAGDEFLTINPKNITFDYYGGTATFVIDTNTDWTIE